MGKIFVRPDRIEIENDAAIRRTLIGIEDDINYIYSRLGDKISVSSISTVSSVETLSKLFSSNATSVTESLIGKADVSHTHSSGFTTLSIGNLSVNSISENNVTIPISSGSITLDCSEASSFVINLNSDITSQTFQNVPVTGNMFVLVLVFIADGTARTITWDASIKWVEGTAPTLTSELGKQDVFTLLTYDGGMSWIAFIGGQNA